MTNYTTRAAGPWYVATTGNDANDCLSVGTACLTIQAAVTKASSGDTINIADGTYVENLTIDKALTLDGQSRAGTIIDAGVNTSVYVVVVTADDVTLQDLHLWVRPAVAQQRGLLIPNGSTVSNLTLDNVNITGAVNRYAIHVAGVALDLSVIDCFFSNNANGIVVADDGLIDGLTLTGSAFDHGPDTTTGETGLYVSNDSELGDDQGILRNATISGNTFTGLSPSLHPGNGIYIEEAQTVLIENNTFTGNRRGIQIYKAHSPARVLSDVTIRGNNFVDQTNAGILIRNYTSVNVVSIEDNTFTDNLRGIAVHGAGTGWNTVHASNNIFTGNGTGVEVEVFNDPPIDDTLGGTPFDATQNWWGNTTGPSGSGPGTGDTVSVNITFDPWYTNAGMTTLSDDTATDATYTSTTDGQADLPAGVTEVVLTNDTVLDVSGGVSTESGGNIIVEGTSQDLGNYTNGDLAGEDLDAVQDVGGTSVTIGTAVNLQSGTDGEPIVLSNSELDNVSVSIPDDTTVLAPAGWDGTIMPPKEGSDSGTAPSGFSVGSTVIEVGSPDFVLLFDRPVTITLTGVTGAVGYKPAGSSVWTQITDTCGGDYTNPTLSAAEFPGECKITNGTDTKILTYHLTTFGSLTVSSSGSSGGGGYWVGFSQPPAPTSGIADPANLARYGLREGDTVSARNTNDPDIYIVNEHGYKRLFLNPVIFNFYGHLGWSKVRSIVPVGRDAFPTSGLFRNCETNDPKVYAVEVTGEDSGTLHHVQMSGDAAVAQDSDFFHKVFCINTNEFNWYPKSLTPYTSLSQVLVYAR